MEEELQRQREGTDPGGYETTPRHPETLGEGDNRPGQRADICVYTCTTPREWGIIPINTARAVPWSYKSIHLHHGIQN